jgi:hypothetical protein
VPRPCMATAIGHGMRMDARRMEAHWGALGLARTLDCPQAGSPPVALVSLVAPEAHRGTGLRSSLIPET